MEYASGTWRACISLSPVLQWRFAISFWSESIFSLDNYLSGGHNANASTRRCLSCSLLIGLPLFILVNPVLLPMPLRRYSFRTGPFPEYVAVPIRVTPIARLSSLVQVIAIFGTWLKNHKAQGIMANVSERPPTITGIWIQEYELAEGEPILRVLT